MRVSDVRGRRYSALRPLQAVRAVDSGVQKCLSGVSPDASPHTLPHGVARRVPQWLV